MPQLRIETPIGALIATPSADPDRPGISVDLDAADGQGIVPVSYTEVEDGTMTTRVWSDADKEDPTAKLPHGNMPAVPDGYAMPDVPKGPLVYVCAPYHGANMRDRMQNVQNARMYALHVLRSGAVPYVAHLAVCGFLDDDIPEERAAGIRVDRHMMDLCDELWVFGSDRSPGVEAEIAYFESCRKPVRYVESIPETSGTPLDG